MVAIPKLMYQGKSAFMIASQKFGWRNVGFVQLKSHFKPRATGPGYLETANKAAEQLLNEGSKAEALEKIKDKTGEYYDYMRQYLTEFEHGN